VSFAGVLVGAGGHARVVADVARCAEGSPLVLVACLDADQRKWGSVLDGIPIRGGDDQLEPLLAEGVRMAALGIGLPAPTPQRAQLFDRVRRMGFSFPPLVHERAVCAPGTALGAGTVVAALAVVNPGAIIGEASIINTGSIIEHDCRLGDHVHLAPGAVLGGEVVVESLAMIGLGACVLPGVRIGSGSLVAAGALVRSDVPPGCVVAGLPGRVVRRTGLK